MQKSILYSADGANDTSNLMMLLSIDSSQAEPINDIQL
jgi:hypothetical protein